MAVRVGNILVDIRQPASRSHRSVLPPDAVSAEGVISECPHPEPNHRHRGPGVAMVDLDSGYHIAEEVAKCLVRPGDFGFQDLAFGLNCGEAGSQVSQPSSLSSRFEKQPVQLGRGVGDSVPEPESLPFMVQAVDAVLGHATGTWLIHRTDVR